VSRRTLVAVLAHPDDESFAVGGTLAKYAVQGANVDLILATRDEAGIPGKRSWEAGEIREDELHKACLNLGIRLLDFLGDIMGHQAWWSVPAAVVLGIPLYPNAAGVIPVVYALMEKGAALGTVLAFMMSVVALSLPEMLILRRVLKPHLIAVFIGIVAVAIILTGYLFNLVIR
jgi:hypothetical protein